MSTIWIKLHDWLKIRNGHGILIYSVGQGLMSDMEYSEYVHYIKAICMQWHYSISMGLDNSGYQENILLISP